MVVRGGGALDSARFGASQVNRFSPAWAAPRSQWREPRADLQSEGNEDFRNESLSDSCNRSRSGHARYCHDRQRQAKRESLTLPPLSTGLLRELRGHRL